MARTPQCTSQSPTAAPAGTSTSTYVRGLRYTLDGTSLVVVHVGQYTGAGDLGGVYVYNATAVSTWTISSSGPSPVAAWTSVATPLISMPFDVIEFDGGFIVACIPLTPKRRVVLVVIQVASPYTGVPTFSTLTDVPVVVEVMTLSLGLAVGGVGSLIVTAPYQSVFVWEFNATCAANYTASTVSPGTCDPNPSATQSPSVSVTPSGTATMSGTGTTKRQAKTRNLPKKKGRACDMVVENHK
jgi:hypothetical protein